MLSSAPDFCPFFLRSAGAWGHCDQGVDPLPLKGHAAVIALPRQQVDASCCVWPVARGPWDQGVAPPCHLWNTHRLPGSGAGRAARHTQSSLAGGTGNKHSASSRLPEAWAQRVSKLFPFFLLCSREKPQYAGLGTRPAGCRGCPPGHTRLGKLGGQLQGARLLKNLATRAAPTSNAPVHDVCRLLGFGPVIHPLCVTSDAGMPNQAVENRQGLDLLNPQLAFTAGETHVVGSRLAGDPPRMA